MIKVRQSLRDAIAENKAHTAEIEKLKAALEAAEAERQELRLRLDRAEAEKTKAVKSSKARYLAELRKLRDAHKAVMAKAVDDAEDRGYEQGEKTYERQVQATKDIFFQCGWKAAVEKVGLGQDSDMFNNLPAAYIPDYMQAYSKAAQIRLIAEARKEAEDEAAAAQETEQIAPEASQDAEQVDRDVADVEGAFNEAEENFPEQEEDGAELTIQAAEQEANIELD